MASLSDKNSDKHEYFEEVEKPHRDRTTSGDFSLQPEI